MKYNKRFTAHLKTIEAKVPAELIIPVSQHIGKPAKIVVEKNDKVKLGQLLAEADGFISANVHSSVSGEIVDIKPMPHPNGGMVLAIIIKNDFEDTPISTNHSKNFKELTKQEIIDKVKDAGIVGLGGATFPTHVKINPNKPVEELIINGAECEPYLTADHRLMLEEVDNLFKGTDLLAKVLEPKKIFIGVENNKPDAIKSLKLAAINYPQVKIVSLPTKYPQGAEKVLVKKITGKNVRKLPIQEGVVVINVATVAQIAKSISTGLPLYDRIVTLSGELLEKRLNLRVRIGTPLEKLLYKFINDQDQLDKISPFKVILGGPMMGIGQHNFDVPVIKGTSGVLIIPNNVPKKEYSCTRCAKCVDSCPLGLIPTLASLKGIQAMECMECGTCAYVCPSKIHLVQRIKLQKNNIMGKK